MNSSSFKLQLRLWIAMALLFGLVYAILIIAGSFLGLTGNFTFFAVIGLVIIFIQYLIGPKIVEKTMKVKYVDEMQEPKLHSIVTDLAMMANIPKPKIGIAEIDVPNAFAFGKTKKDGRVCVTRGILNILDEDELKAVLGHELAHIKHNDMIVTTIASAIPLVCYYIFMSFLFGGNRENNGAGLAIGLLALVAYFVGQLIVLFISRVREYYADEGSIEMGAKPDKLASALYKLVYGAAASDEKAVKDIEGVKAFFLNDISNAKNEINDLSQLDLDKDGTISYSELQALKESNVKVKTGAKAMELLSTHPNMLKRIKKLAELNN
ncbi:MAG: zinc metalloprotease HtpX [Methanobacteriaceae archaeon]